MKKVKMSLALILLSVVTISAVTHLVSLDGSGDYLGIQSAISASTHGDSILVYPGTYFENLNYSGKNIHIYSLEKLTGNSAYRDSTIIDGGMQGSVIKSTLSTNNCGLYGFTIRNGIGDPDMWVDGAYIRLGGGVYIKSATNFQLHHCKIYKNSAIRGGGVYALQSNLHISGCDITVNSAELGGGINIQLNSRIYFSETDRSSVYNNLSANGQDIAISSIGNNVDIYLDMGTVDYYNPFFIRYTKAYPNSSDNLGVVAINRAYLREESADFYVSPEGNDENDGLSLQTPFRSIFKAYHHVKSDSLNPRTIHLASGVYSSAANYLYPLPMKSWVRLKGTGAETCIFENSQYRVTVAGSWAINAILEGVGFSHQENPELKYVITQSMPTNVLIKDVTINGCISSYGTGMRFSSNSDYSSNVKIDGVRILNQSAPYHSGLSCVSVDLDADGLVIENCHTTGASMSFVYPPLYFGGHKLNMRNSKILNNSVNHDEFSCVSISNYGTMDFEREIKLSNVLIANNESSFETPVFISHRFLPRSLISNCTFAANRGAPFALGVNGNIDFVNCIFDNDTYLESKSAATDTDLRFYNSLVRGYPSSVYVPPGASLSFLDPMFDTHAGFCSDDHSNAMSYRLSNNSVCRDMGTLDFPNMYIPDTDLAGEPRVYGTSIDIGSFEWNYPVSAEEEVVINMPQIRIYPNPFNPETTISLHLQNAAHLWLNVYNTKGQRVRTIYKALISSGAHSFHWDGKDEGGNPVGSGIYYCKAEYLGKSYVQKMLLMK